MVNFRSRNAVFTGLIFIILFLVIFPQNVWTQEKGWGLGIILGEPTGVSFKKWLNKKHAIDAAAAWSFGSEDAFHLHGDYLFHNRNLINIDGNRIPFYYGVGGRLKFQDQSRFGIRFPVGITFFIREAPIDIFFELVPILDLAPSTDFDLNAAIGARYYFH
jgi:hypothetical protein